MSRDEALHNGAILREAMVEEIVDRYAPLGNPDTHVRFATFGAVREGVLAAVREIALAYPQLSERIQARFGMTGWATE